MDPEWSETGDRYLLKLFRDYLFHQVTETGSAWIDFAHRDFFFHTEAECPIISLRVKKPLCEKASA